MRTPGVAIAVVALTSAASAAPLATLREDVTGDGVAESIELGADGVVTIAGKRRATVRVAPSASRGALAVAQVRGRALLVVDVTRDGAREGILLEPAGAGWREVLRTPLGGVGLDADYSVELDLTPNGLYRYQTRPGLRRCDGKPGYLFAEGFDGTRFRRLAKIPSGVPESVPVLTARPDPGAVAAPLLFQARAASLQIGANNAGALSIPHELDDGKPETVWREELAASAGEGQFFTFEPRMSGVQARQLRIVPGDPTSARAMKATNRPRRLAIATEHRAWRVELPDAAREALGTAYVIDLPEPVDGCVTVVLEDTYGQSRGVTAIAELEVFADGERSGGGDAMLARIVAEGKEGETSAAAALARRGAAGAAAIDAELAKTRDPVARRRLLAVLVKIQDPAVVASLSRAVAEHWATGPALLELIEALATHGLAQELAAIAGDTGLEVEARIAAVRRLPATGKELGLLAELAGTGSRELRRAVIDRLSEAAIPELVTTATSVTSAAAAGDLWRAITRGARDGADRDAALAAMASALDDASDYERRYRLVDGIATLGDKAALARLAAFLRALPEGAPASALRQVAVRAIAAAPRPDAVGLVLSLAEDPDPGVRLAVLGALAGAAADAPGPWHTPDGPDGIDRLMINALADRWPEVRRRAAVSLGSRCQRPGPARALAGTVAKDDAVDVRVDALAALVQCRAPGIDQLLARTWDDAAAPLLLREQAVNLAVALEDRRLGAQLVERFRAWRAAALESEAALALAQRAAATIALLDAPGAAQALVEALDDAAFPEIVRAAALALGAMGPTCPRTARTKLNALARSGDQAAVAARRAAAQCGR